MEQKINIAELLKCTPKGTKLYSSIYGDVLFYQVRTDNQTIEVLAGNTYKHFDYYGYPIWRDNSNIMYIGKECMLFPSKDRRTWENFNAPWKHKHFEPFQKVLVGLVCNYQQYWRADLYSHYREDIREHCTLKESMVQDNLIIPYEGNEDKLGKEVGLFDDYKFP